MADLDKMDLETDELGPFILEGAMEGWPMLKSWPVEWKDKLVALFPKAPPQPLFTFIVASVHPHSWPAC